MREEYEESNDWSPDATEKGKKVGTYQVLNYFTLPFSFSDLGHFNNLVPDTDS